MSAELGSSLEKAQLPNSDPQFNMIWLLDDFSGSGNTYIRFDNDTSSYKGKIKKVYEQLHKGELVNTTHYEMFLLLYVATRQAMDHIEYWCERFTSENNYKPLQLRVLCIIERSEAIARDGNDGLSTLLENSKYVDQSAVDKHFLVGGTDDATWGFAGCGLPVVLSHNTPNNSLYLLWGSETLAFHGLFPRVRRHRES